ncbi:membrane protein [Microbacterium phage Pikmin]|uniref:Membrane protein n=3 Tax=Pikminvirus pikmin TaxID=2560596 RepID=A0A2P1CKI3_9CAUD|nr:membrane protein [Microbacterium phage Pikmin]AVJ51015.1 membrane protein [Microbacterium phage Pajaza]AVJ51162.1 membrane protein [Microbacterium phage Pikmin]AVJ51720.1 membrane protein [Microbacterium phage Casey]
MLETIMELFEAAIPVFVAGVTAYGAVLVAKVNKIQKDIKTNHGSKNLGDAIDRLTTKVSTISDNQDDLISTVKAMQSRDKALEDRVGSLEETRNKHLFPHVKTGSVRLPGNRFKKGRKK